MVDVVVHVVAETRPIRLSELIGYKDALVKVRAQDGLCADCKVYLNKKVGALMAEVTV